MQLQKHLFYELILVIGSVFVFRSMWTLMDRISLFNDSYVHAVFLILGTVLTIYGITKLTHKH